MNFETPDEAAYRSDDRDRMWNAFPCPCGEVEKTMSEKNCNCDSCKRTPYFNSLAAKATTEEKEALDWVWAAMEATETEVAMADIRHRETLAEKDRQINELTLENEMSREDRRAAEAKAEEGKENQ